MRILRRRKQAKDLEIVPEDIFLDSSNSSDLDKDRFEGRLEKPLSRRTYHSLGVIVVIMMLVLSVRASYLQIVRGAAFAAQSENNSLDSTELFAPRGVILDRNGVKLVQNKERDDGSITRDYLLPSMGQVIGYISRPKKDSKGNYYDTTQTGVAGIEAEYNEILSGVNGQILIERDALGKIHSSGTIEPAKEGAALTLSIDINVQKNLADAIERTATSKGFIAGSGVLLDVNTGEVIGLVSYPSYDPNVMSAGEPAATIASYNNSPGHPFLDHAVQGVYAPGSIVKPFISAGALEDGIITANTVIEDRGRLVVADPYTPGKEYFYNGWKALGPVDVEKAIAWSSDIFFYVVGGGFGDKKGMGIDRLAYWYSQFGFGSPTGIDLPEEAAGRIPTPEWKRAALDEPWYLGDTYFTSIGQYSMQVTPIQAARATASLVNGGNLIAPTLRLPDASVPTVVQSTIPVTEESLRIVRSGMRQTVTSALAQQLNVPYLKVAGKTGTAETGTRNQYDNSWIVGYFPYDNPKYAFAVVLERGPAGSGSQAVNAMRLFLDLMHEEDSIYVGGSGASTTPSAILVN